MSVHPGSPVTQEVVEQDTQRAKTRIQDAINDTSGRLKLYLNALHFPDMDYDVERITTLEQLYADHNALLTRLPPSLGNLHNLRVLQLSHCALQSLPEDLSRLHKLERVDVSHNMLKRFVWDVSQWESSLQVLDVSHNPIEYFSPSCVGLFRTLQKKQQAAEKVQLHAEQTLLIAPNDSMFQPQTTSHVNNAGEVMRVLGSMLPDEVETCSLCKKTVLVGRPHVYVHFWVWNGKKVSMVAAADQRDGADCSYQNTPQEAHLAVPSESQSKAEGAPQHFGNSKRIPIFYPLCHNIECHLKTHKIVLSGERRDS